MAELDVALRQLGREIEFPPTPDGTLYVSTDRDPQGIERRIHEADVGARRLRFQQIPCNVLKQVNSVSLHT